MANVNVNALNAICFNQDHWKLVAKGYDVRAWYDEGLGKGTGGIQSPVRMPVHIGHKYYRFASGDTPRSAQLGGGWWISHNTYSTINEYAKQNALSLQYSARLWLALPYDWTRVDRVISAYLMEPIDAYEGAGKQVTTATDNWTPPQHIKLTQMYIPGLIKNSKEDNLYKRIWNKVETTYPHSGKKVKGKNASKKNS